MPRQKASKRMFPCRNPQVCGVKNHYNGTVCRSPIANMTPSRLLVAPETGNAMTGSSLRTVNEETAMLTEITTRTRADVSKTLRGRKDSFQTSDPSPPEKSTKKSAPALGNDTQRTSGYKGGIQAGTTAISRQSTSIETALQAAVTKFNQGSPGRLWKKSETAQNVASRLGIPESSIAGISPDGGIWTGEEGSDQIILAAEAKKQGAKGNAIERWYKNWMVLSRLNVGIYLTVCLGEGFFDDNSAQRIMETAVALEPDAQERFRENNVWNVPVGRLWLYRYKAVPPVSEFEHILELGFMCGKERLR